MSVNVKATRRRQNGGQSACILRYKWLILQRISEIQSQTNNT
nr:MAG TPA: hypothetical protein [Caudoviricetes sp.]